MKAQDVMNKNVIYTTLPNTRDSVLQLLKEHHISAVPIVKNGDLAGIVTRKDLLRKIDEDQLALLMTPKPTTVQINDPIEEVAEIFANTKFRRVPVLKDNQLMGIITLRDMVKMISEMSIEEPIRDHISASTTCVWEETPLNIVGEIMRVANAELCPVLDNGAEIVGIVDEKIMLTESLIEEFIEQTHYSSSSDSDDDWTWDSIRDFSVKYFEVSVVKLPKEPVKNYMKKAAFVYPQTLVSKCAREMVRQDLDHIPVLDVENRLMGMLDDKELVKVLLK
ncbi:MAG: CBS domain-containing protein [Archaeoglobaceae archaeon]